MLETLYYKGIVRNKGLVARDASVLQVARRLLRSCLRSKLSPSDKSLITIFHSSTGKPAILLVGLEDRQEGGMGLRDEAKAWVV